MATNKRKDAAALFELIDKSTLKVPKNAGALKIPSWWSSKTNPTPMPPAPPPRPAPSPLSRTLGQPAAPQTEGAAGEAKGTGALAKGEVGAERGVNGHANGNGHAGQGGHAQAYPANGVVAGPVETGVKPESQQRLFQPPPANAPPASTPSIRPPARIPVMPGASAPAPAPVAAEAAAAPVPETAPVKEVAAAAEAARPVAAAPKGAGVAGAGSLRPWPPENRDFFANVPRWAIPVAAGTLVLLIVAVLFVAMRHHGDKGAATETGGGVETSITGPGAGSGTPGPVAPPAGGGVAGRAPDVAPGTGAAAAGITGENVGTAVSTLAGGTARIYEPGQYRFNGESLYVFIATSSSESVTRRNAKFIAEHGVDVAIEKSGDKIYLIAARPCANIVAAEALVKKVRELGKLHPDYKATNKVFADAFTKRVVIKEQK
jgi:hypothetical protein